MTKSFKEAYDILNRHAQTLRNQQDPNIDELLSIVTESVSAYKICRQRIDAVEAALEAALSDPAVASSAAGADDELEGPPATPSAAVGRTARPENKATGFDDMDDDIPF